MVPLRMKTQRLRLVWKLTCQAGPGPEPPLLGAGSTCKEGPSPAQLRPRLAAPCPHAHQSPGLSCCRAPVLGVGVSLPSLTQPPARLIAIKDENY